MVADSVTLACLWHGIYHRSSAGMPLKCREAVLIIPKSSDLVVYRLMCGQFHLTQRQMR